MRWLAVLSAVAVATPWTWAAAGDLYRCDVGGKVVYQDRPCAAGSTEQRMSPAAKPADSPSSSTSEMERETYAPYEKAGISDQEKCSVVPVSKEDRDAAIRVARREISSRLKDPYSAKIGLSHARLDCTSGRREFVCGTINAKNSYGGYTGSKLWLISLADGSVVSWSDEQKLPIPITGRMINAAAECVRKGTISVNER